VGYRVNADPIDRAVREFMTGEGIDPNRVNWYRVTKVHGDLAVLELKMFMNDLTESAPAEKNEE
jgi:hypothetical protein